MILESDFLINSRFLIPRGRTENGVCLASIIDSYLKALAYDRVDTPGKSPLIRTGRTGKPNKPSIFVKTPIGVNSLYNVGKDVAEFLQLANPELFTGHCFRRSSATQLANSGCSVMELKQKFHWDGDKMPLVYVANSDANMNKMASMLSGVDSIANLKEEKFAEMETDSASPTEVAKSVEIDSALPTELAPSFELDANEAGDALAKIDLNQDVSRPKTLPFTSQLFNGNYRLENCTFNVSISN